MQKDKMHTIYGDPIQHISGRDRAQQVQGKLHNKSNTLKHHPKKFHR